MGDEVRRERLPTHERRAASKLLALAVSAAICGCSGTSAPAPGTPAPLAARPASSPRSNTVVSEEPWTFGTARGLVITTPSYRLFTTVQAGFIADRLPNFAETALARYRTAFATLPAPSVALDMYVVANRPQWLRLAAQLLGPEGSAYQQITRGGVTVNGRAILYDIGVRDTFSLVGHEGWHQYTQTAFREPLPIWLEEGIATVMEGYRWQTDDPTRPEFLAWCNLERFDLLRDAVGRDSLLALPALLSGSPASEMEGGSQSALVYYAQVWALTLFLFDGDDSARTSALSSLLADAQRGSVSGRVRTALGERAASAYLHRRTGPEVFLAYFDRDLARADRQFRAFCTSVVGISGRDAVAAGRSPLRSHPGAR